MSKEAEKAARIGEVWFQQIGCATCHIPNLPLVNRGWIYSEPNPYNPTGNLQPGQAPALSIDLTSDELPGPRLKPDSNGIVWVPAYSDLKLHDITSGPGGPNAEPLDQDCRPMIGTASSSSSSLFRSSQPELTRRSNRNGVVL